MYLISSVRVYILYYILLHTQFFFPSYSLGSAEFNLTSLTEITIIFVLWLKKSLNVCLKAVFKNKGLATYVLYVLDS